MLWAGGLGAGAVACAASAAPSPLPPALVASAGSAGLVKEVPKDRPPLATPGEQMVYRLTLHGLEIGQYGISVGEATVLDGVDVVVVQSFARSSSVASWVKKIDFGFTSWIDRASGRSRLFSAAENEAPEGEVREVTEARFAGDVIRFHVVRPDGDTDEVQTVTGHGGYDITSFLVFLRGWEAEPGARVEADIVRSRYVWRNRLMVAGYGNLDTPLGEIAVVRYDGEAVRLRRDGTIDPASDRRRWSIWISDDADRVPIRLVAHTDYGDIEMNLVSYQPAPGASR